MDAIAFKFSDNGPDLRNSFCNESQHAPPEDIFLRESFRLMAEIGKYWIAMENRTARLTLLIDPTKKQIFEEICAVHDLTPSQVVRQMIREYVQEHGSPEQLQRMPVNTKSKS